MQKQDFINIITGKKSKKEICDETDINASTLTYQYQQMLKPIAADIEKFLEKII